jgi:hypothetical protein
VLLTEAQSRELLAKYGVYANVPKQDASKCPGFSTVSWHQQKPPFK